MTKKAMLNLLNKLIDENRHSECDNDIMFSFAQVVLEEHLGVSVDFQKGYEKARYFESNPLAPRAALYEVVKETYGAGRYLNGAPSKGDK